jgi:hypothetical protein
MGGRAAKGYGAKFREGTNADEDFISHLSLRVTLWVT